MRLMLLLLLVVCSLGSNGAFDAFDDAFYTVVIVGADGADVLVVVSDVMHPGVR